MENKMDSENARRFDQLQKESHLCVFQSTLNSLFGSKR